jgi:peptide/nickel transport system permease protein
VSDQAALEAQQSAAQSRLANEEPYHRARIDPTLDGATLPDCNASIAVDGRVDDTSLRQLTHDHTGQNDGSVALPLGSPALDSNRFGSRRDTPASQDHLVRLRVVRLGKRLSPAAWFGLAIVGLLVGLALFGPMVAGDPHKQVLRDRLLPPMLFGGSASHPFGTDQLGRDLLARVIAGARVTLLLSAAVTWASILVGVTLGMVAGLKPGRPDSAIRFLVDVQIALPVVVVAIAASALFSPGFLLVFLVLFSTGWVAYQRVVRLQTRSLSTAQFVEASRSIGATEGWIVRRHLLPNLGGTIAVLATQQMAAVILFEAALSYLGLGMPPDAVTWGRMVADGRETMFNAWWVAVVPGVFIALAVLGFNLVGEWFGTRRPGSAS